MFKYLVSFLLFISTVESLGALGDPERYWAPGQTLHILFMDGETRHHEFVKTYATEWTKYANLKFVFHSERQEGQFYEIRISFFGCKNSAKIGTKALEVEQDEPTMLLPDIYKEIEPLDARQRIVRHEFGHALALKHEHKSPMFGLVYGEAAIQYCIKRRLNNMDCMEPRLANREVVLAEFRSKCESNYLPTTKEGLQMSPFDPDSVMMYNIFPGFIESHPDFVVKKSTEISLQDRKFIGEIYPFPESPLH